MFLIKNQACDLVVRLQARSGGGKILLTRRWGRDSFRVGQSTGDWPIARRLEEEERYCQPAAGGGIVFVSGSQPEIGQLPDAWRRRKDIVNPPLGAGLFSCRAVNRRLANCPTLGGGGKISSARLNEFVSQIQRFLRLVLLFTFLRRQILHQRRTGPPRVHPRTTLLRC